VNVLHGSAAIVLAVRVREYLIMRKQTAAMWTLALFLVACGSMPISKIAPPLQPSGQASLCDASAAASAFVPTGRHSSGSETADPAEAAALATVFDLRTLVARKATIDHALSARVKKEPVYTRLSDALEYVVYETQRGLVANSGVRAEFVPAGVGTIAPGSLSENDFRSFSKAIQEELLSPPFAYAGASSADHGGDDFKKYFTAYFSAYFSGKFVDRFGQSLPKPVLSRNIGDTEISGTATVFVELLLDYWLRTPVWKDSAGKFYPGQFGSDGPPTAVTEGLAVQLPLVTDSKQCGIDALKAKAVQYIANTAGTKASSIGGLIGGSFGGLHFGFGILGKFSVGDNQTLNALVKSLLGKGFERAGEETSYRTLYWIRYDGNDLTELLQKYLDRKNSAA
jgi:hypothetical protein